MSTPIKVTFHSISDAASDVRTTAANVQAQLDELKAGVARVAQSWEGVAQQKYQARQAEWDSTAANLHEVLLQIAGALQNASDNYQATENKNAGIWGG
ncbi:WXG100 family type VII secretion target [Streptacidiphilus sp. 4-A2]|nr:WXG100 family type VII secretion target [Streptacidiphilus sp. 4-A2]